MFITIPPQVYYLGVNKETDACKQAALKCCGQDGQTVISFLMRYPSGAVAGATVVEWVRPSEGSLSGYHGLKYFNGSRPWGPVSTVKL